MRVLIENCSLVSNSKLQSNAEEIEWIADEIKCESFDAKDVIYESGDFSSDSYIVLSGEFSQLVP